MSWSTRQVADIAGTTVKAVRHYHAMGLLDEPERQSNGYKKYTTAHLLRILQIRRLGELGVPLAQVATMGAPSQDPHDVIRVIDAELASTIERLQRIRAELALMAQHGAELDVPADFAAIAGSLTKTDRALMTIYARLFDKEAADSLRDSMANGSPDDEAFNTLPEDASDEMITELARRLVPAAISAQQQAPWKAGLAAHSRLDADDAEQILGQVIVDLYNPAQLKVMLRVKELTDQAQSGGAHPDQAQSDQATPPGSANLTR